MNWFFLEESVEKLKAQRGKIGWYVFLKELMKRNWRLPSPCPNLRLQIYREEFAVSFFILSGYSVTWAHLSPAGRRSKDFSLGKLNGYRKQISRDGFGETPSSERTAQPWQWKPLSSKLAKDHWTFEEKTLVWKRQQIFFSLVLKPNVQTYSQ